MPSSKSPALSHLHGFGHHRSSLLNASAANSAALSPTPRQHEPSHLRAAYTTARWRRNERRIEQRSWRHHSCARRQRVSESRPEPAWCRSCRCRVLAHLTCTRTDLWQRILLPQPLRACSAPPDAYAEHGASGHEWHGWHGGHGGHGWHGAWHGGSGGNGGNGGSGGNVGSGSHGGWKYHATN